VELFSTPPNHGFSASPVRFTFSAFTCTPGSPGPPFTGSPVMDVGLQFEVFSCRLAFLEVGAWRKPILTRFGVGLSAFTSSGIFFSTLVAKPPQVLRNSHHPKRFFSKLLANSFCRESEYRRSNQSLPFAAVVQGLPPGLQLLLPTNRRFGPKRRGLDNR